MTTENHDVNAAEKNRDFCGSRRQCDYRQTDRGTGDQKSLLKFSVQVSLKVSLSTKDKVSAPNKAILIIAQHVPF